MTYIRKKLCCLKDLHFIKIIKLKRIIEVKYYKEEMN